MIALEVATALGPLRADPAHVRLIPDRHRRPLIKSSFDGDTGTVLSGSAPVGTAVWARTAAPGQQLGRYQLIERLGQGCQGEVWRAFEIGSDGDDVALKLLPASLARDPKRLAQFRHEAERGARIAGPSLLTTYEYGEADGLQFMAMPLVDGCSLADVVGWRRQPGPGHLALRLHRLAFAGDGEYLPGILRILARVGRALEGVHAAGVVHRDIKPANILLDRRHDEEGFLCDFGLGRDLDIATPAQLRDGAGTPLYMAPERLLRQPADERLCDIFALGATLFEALTLRPPAHVPDDLPWHDWNVYLAAVHPPTPSKVREGLPRELDAIVLKAIDRQPERRYPTLGSLAADIERFLAGAPILAEAASA